MKILVVAEKEHILQSIKKHLPPLGFDFIFYNNPVKALDNLAEISPELIIFSAEDYPRHWKPFLKVLRNSFSHEKCIFIILKTSYFSFEDAEKSIFLGANGLVDEDLEEYADAGHGLWTMAHRKILVGKYREIVARTRG